MGFNTVAVLYNDYMADLRRDGPIGEQIAAAMLQWSVRSRDPLATHFGAGMVVSQAHADWSQVVIVSRNSGVRACDANDLDFVALSEMAECLERHGYKVTKPRKRKPSPTAPDPSPSAGDEGRS
ncbi:hypothetical protein [Methylobacterium sp. Leaf118]|uniref:hypothetical protein n=1 Tax=Methylobacterium sp. Leaf118 TaxID=2876562 RepID=UPI001E423FC3|nr:hypothetical protein [Methylobacterium sp. Leaf118]